jgi:phosphate transport system substrate-binding protein
MKNTTIFRIICLAAIVAVVATGCRRAKVTRTDTETSGYAQIAVDETLSPVIAEQLAVFMGLNPEAKIDPIYAGERQVFDLLMSDSVRLVIAAKELTPWQVDSLKKLKLTPRTQLLACDGIALIVNPQNPDSLIGIPTLRDIMSGKISRWSELPSAGGHREGDIRVVFDNPSSSALQYLNDSVMGGETFSDGLRALESNKAVVEYVAANPNALGVVGVSWIKDSLDSSQLNFNRAIKVMAVGTEREVNDDNAFKPYPAFLNNGSYPLRRDIFIIISDTYDTLPSGFVKFAAGDAGQRILLKAGLVPGTRPSREIAIVAE